MKQRSNSTASTAREKAGHNRGRFSRANARVVLTNSTGSLTTNLMLRPVTLSEFTMTDLKWEDIPFRLPPLRTMAGHIGPEDASGSQAEVQYLHHHFNTLTIYAHITNGEPT